jgi:hypothetical protein
MPNKLKRLKSKQKFHKGDLVKIANEMPREMAHFPNGLLAIIDGSYANKYTSSSKSDFEIYGVIIIDRSGLYYTAWYQEDQLTMVCEGFFDKLAERNEFA